MDKDTAERHLNRIKDLIHTAANVIGETGAARIDDVQDGIPGYGLGSLVIFPTVAVSEGDGKERHTWTIQRLVEVRSHNREVQDDMDVVSVGEETSDIEAVKTFITEYVKSELDDILPFVGMR